jgi:hypothetical protein
LDAWKLGGWEGERVTKVADRELLSRLKIGKF